MDSQITLQLPLHSDEVKKYQADSPESVEELPCEKQECHIETLRQGPAKRNLFGDEGERVVLLVTAPIGSSFNLIVQAIGRQPPLSPPVDWDSHENIALPDLASRLKFTTHYALCVIDGEVWGNKSLTLLEKFGDAKFWDHPGDCTMMASAGSSRSNSSMIPTDLNACRTWHVEQIKCIDSGEEIGRTNLADTEISKVYTDLRNDWTYMPVFWNCHDLAIRLAHLIISPSTDAIEFLRGLMNSLRQAYHREINWYSTVRRVSIGSWGIAAVGCFIAPPLAAAGLCAFMAGGSVMALGGNVHFAKLRTRRKLMLTLEERFPALKSLHDE